MNQKPLILSVHGPAGSGKTTLAKLLALDLGLCYLDTDAIFQALAVAISEHMAKQFQDYETSNDPEAIEHITDTIMPDIEMRILEWRAVPYYKGKGIEQAAKQPGICDMSKRLESIQTLSEQAMQKIRSAVKTKDCIIDGHLAKHLFSNTNLRFFLTADARTRGERITRKYPGRYRSKDHAISELDAIPCPMPNCAVRIDNTNLNLAETLRLMHLIVKTENFPQLRYKRPQPHPETIAVFVPYTPEYDRLSLAARLISDYAGIPCTVKNTYFDYGAGMRWTTLIACPEDGLSYQMLDTKQQTDILYGAMPDALLAIENAAVELRKKYKTS